MNPKLFLLCVCVSFICFTFDLIAAKKDLTDLTEAEVDKILQEWDVSGR